MTVLAVLPGKAPERIELDGSLESMQQFVGGTIQAVYPFSDPVAIVCNDEGKLMGLEHNRALRDEAGNVYDILCGPFFICGLGEEDFASLSEELIQKYTRLFQHPELFLRVGNQLMVVPF
ncbi:MAG: DUF3846 domain-containing protein [Clostridiales bacterium]|nr:DUF3846 domain-containing protein [Clostridiales bacterium]